MIHSTVHTHTDFCDGVDSMERMAAEAFKRGLKCLGFSGHSYVELDNFGIPPTKMAEYITEAKRVKSLYCGKMDVLCGLEVDSLTTTVKCSESLDYTIGSAHSVRGEDGVDYIVDESAERLKMAANMGFGGSFIKLCAAYFSQFSAFVFKTRPDIVGHFDLVTKFNEKGNFFYDSCPVYTNASLLALDTVLESGAVIEVNTGAISRGYRTAPYPAVPLLKRIWEKKGRVIITTDAHAADTITAYTEEAEELLRSVGFTSVCELSAHGFYERGL